jgi:hypothetical protein
VSVSSNPVLDSVGSGEGAGVHPRALDALLAWAALSSRRVEVDDLLVIVGECGACDRVWSRGFSKLERSEPLATLGATFDYLDAVLRRRPPELEASLWEHSRRCDCAAPVHHTRTREAHLLRPMHGSGAHVLVSSVTTDHGSARGLARLPFDGFPQALAGSTHESVERAFGRPFTLFHAWPAVRDSSSPATLHRVQPGVTVARFEGDTPASLSEASGVLGVLIEATTVRSFWPPELEPIASDIEAGRARYALVFERRTLFAQLRLLAAARLGAEITRLDDERAALEHGGLVWPISLAPIARSAATSGRTLGDVCASALQRALEEIDRGARFLREAASLRPDVRFEIDEDRVTPVRRDGRGRSFDLAQVANASSVVDTAELVRQLAFLCDEVPPWGDPSRSCPCRALATLQRRIVPWESLRSFEKAHGEAPWILEEWTAHGAPRAASVLAVACDRHVRFPTRTALQESGLHLSCLAERLEEDAARAHHRVAAKLLEGEAGRQALLVRGSLCAGLLLDDGWVVELLRVAGASVDRAVAWAFGPNAFCVLHPDIGEPDARRLAHLAASLGGGPSFAIRRTLDLDAVPRGTMEMLPVE